MNINKLEKYIKKLNFLTKKDVHSSYWEIHAYPIHKVLGVKKNEDVKVTFRGKWSSTSVKLTCQIGNNSDISLIYTKKKIRLTDIDLCEKEINHALSWSIINLGFIRQ